MTKPKMTFVVFSCELGLSLKGIVGQALISLTVASSERKPARIPLEDLPAIATAGCLTQKHAGKES